MKVLPKAGEDLAEVAETPGMWEKIGNWWRGYLPKQEAIDAVAKFNPEIDSVFGAVADAPASMQKALGEQYTTFRDKLYQQMTQLKKSLSNAEKVPAKIKTELNELELETKQINERLPKIQQQLASTPPPPPLKSDAPPEVVKSWRDHTSFVNELQKNQDELERALVQNQGKTQAAQKELQSATADEDYIQGLVNDVDIAQQKINTNLSDGIKYVQDMDEKFQESGKSNLTELQYVKSWYDNIKNKIKEEVPKLMSHKLQSQNIDMNAWGEWKNFLKGYARTKTLTPEVQAAWKANPKNVETLNLLLNNPNPKIKALAQAIDKGAETAGKTNIAKWVGQSPRDLAYKFGVPVGAISAATIGGIGVVGWLAHHSAKEAGNEIAKISQELSTIGPNSKSATAVANLKRSLDHLAGSWNDIDKNLTNDPDSVAKGSLQALGPDMQAIAHADWNNITENCADKEKATQIEQELSAVLEDKLNTFDKAISGQPITTSAQNTNVGGNNTSKVQQFLISNGFTSVKITGEVDADTMTALRQLERLFGSYAQDNRFMGRFVDTASKKIINYEDLIKANNMIERYKNR